MQDGITSHHQYLGDLVADMGNELDALTHTAPEQADHYFDTEYLPVAKAVKVSSHYYHEQLKRDCPF
jgi:hypothetical protein